MWNKMPSCKYSVDQVLVADRGEAARTLPDAVPATPLSPATMLTLNHTSYYERFNKVTCLRFCLF